MEVSGEKNRDLYLKEVHEGAKIFEESFKARQTSKIQPQKELYDKSMRESLQAIHDAAKGLMSKKIMKMKEQLEKDYQNYLSHPDKQTETQVQKDINHLKNA